jgi:hypothetical protein
MPDPEILAGWVNKRVRMQVHTLGIVEGVLLRTDEVGGLFEITKLTSATSEGLLEMERTDNSIPTHCFIPWGHMEFIIPFPGQLP